MHEFKLTNPTRLLGAADTLLKALETSAGPLATVDVYIGRSGNSETLPLGAFTPQEYIEATRLLIRLGIVSGATTQGDVRAKRLSQAGRH